MMIWTLEECPNFHTRLEKPCHLKSLSDLGWFGVFLCHLEGSEEDQKRYGLMVGSTCGSICMCPIMNWIPCHAQIVTQDSEIYACVLARLGKRSEREVPLAPLTRGTKV